MGLEIYPVYQPRVQEAELKSDGKVLMDEFATLDIIAEELRLPLFSSFGDNRPVPDDFDGDLEELDEVQGPCDVWFNPADGLATLEGILGAIAPGAIQEPMLEEPESVRELLTELVAGLKIAQAKGVKFRFEVG